MNREERLAYLNAQVACANAEIAAMQTTNTRDQMQGFVPHYTPEDFRAVPKKFGIDREAVIRFFADSEVGS